MIKALFKKQMMEVFSWVYKNKKTGKNRSKNGIAVYALLYVIIFVFLGSIFYKVADMLCAPLVSIGFTWMYFALMGLISVALGVFGSVFNTYSSLYLAKDNDFLLSMPVLPSQILTVRLFGVFVMGMMYELIVMVPTIIVYFLNVPVNAAGVVFTLLIPIILSVFVLTLSCILGWVVALIGSKLKNKNIVTVVLSLAFIAGYYYVYAKAYSMLQAILANPEAVGNSIKSVLYPFYHMGLAAEGNPLSMLIFTAVMVAIFAVVYLVLSRSFLKLATTKRTAARNKYKEKALKKYSADNALLRKELKRFLGSTVYMLNCGLGIVIMLIAAVALLIKGGVAAELLYGVFGADKSAVFLIAAAALCMVTTMNDISAASVSLEGKNLWLVQVFPVSAWQALKAKLKLHLLLTLIPAFIMTACAEIVFKPDAVFAVLIMLSVGLFVLFMAQIGLFINLKMPVINWTDETVPVKQSMGVMLTLFGGWALVVAFGGLYFAVMRFITPMLYLICVCAVLTAGCIAVFLWLKTKGTEIFEAL